MLFLQKFLIKLSNQKVGEDEFGNRYYQGKNDKRFVVYKGIAEPSKVPAKWFGWLHHTSDILPTKTSSHKYSWEKIHLPNLTGTNNSYSPRNSANPVKTKPYQAWQPKN
jgi:NADH:ubiquinone oxidoreductase subunit